MNTGQDRRWLRTRRGKSIPRPDFPWSFSLFWLRTCLPRCACPSGKDVLKGSQQAPSPQTQGWAFLRQWGPPQHAPGASQHQALGSSRSRADPAPSLRQLPPDRLARLTWRSLLLADVSSWTLLSHVFRTEWQGPDFWLDPSSRYPGTPLPPKVFPAALTSSQEGSFCLVARRCNHGSRPEAEPTQACLSELQTHVGREHRFQFSVVGPGLRSSY